MDESDLSGESAAKKLGKDPAQIFKTLVFAGEKNGFGVCCIPSCEELDLKKTAKIFGEKKIEMLHVKDLLKTTGYIRGGCTPIGMKKQYKTVIHSSAQDFEQIIVSGGKLGAQLELTPQDLAKACQAVFGDIIAD